MTELTNQPRDRLDSPPTWRLLRCVFAPHRPSSARPPEAITSAHCLDRGRVLAKLGNQPSNSYCLKVCPLYYCYAFVAASSPIVHREPFSSSEHCPPVAACSFVDALSLVGSRGFRVHVQLDPLVAPQQHLSALFNPYSFSHTFQELPTASHSLFTLSSNAHELTCLCLRSFKAVSNQSCLMIKLRRISPLRWLCRPDPQT